MGALTVAVTAGYAGTVGGAIALAAHILRVTGDEGREGGQVSLRLLITLALLAIATVRLLWGSGLLVGAVPA